MPFGVKVIRQNNEGLVETLGKYSHTLSSGLHFYIPVIQRVRTVSLAMQPKLLPKYSLITKDNAEVLGSVSLNYHVTEPVKYQYENTDSVMSMVQLVRGHLRDIIGRMDLNEVLGSTKEINKELADAIGDLTDIYGINVDRINIDELTPSKAIQEAMNTQLTADRERQAEISRAEGDAKSVELRTKAQNEALVATAEANAQATKTKADAEKYRIDKIQEALRGADDKYFNAQSIEAFSNLANSDTNMVVVPNDGADSYGQMTTFAKLLKQNNEKKETKE
ncbi:SPFH domain-containing protein [Apilactobacillus kunkeei]|uniref:Membrane protease family stomatin prohibitin-like protein n=1 Tax=Apilactobacillus kunkeei DSM 12361 = ATCC 700308 TaxID=1423768 RepID=A0A0R1FR82_9LACO|nr:SPFH domain-containing protein [Apilactobacillus kunkeei]KOY70456.1 putative peptidase [Apilactobacillus kunkeei]KOY74687.1 putative peptidase [Apilactobacillus kunkeei DSM 12361 = ATCC 700308]KPN83756.1 putative peptidase [Apilactobacillus kunkeei]KRK24297.1 membrane protease family stomatin prohibitin-like protein [Apilactobacillus kunkeei DSM 12361 = ATCC 700308]MCK8626491.1 SPFH/Band 7/PHB domain protein [Apilactobacillus kunkeei]